MKFSRVWIFDLDNTLHNATPHIFPRINVAMTAYLKTHLGLDEAEATLLRRHYWQRYGATLIGLMRHHATDPRHFLRDTHRLPDLERLLIHEPGLRATLRRLPGRKLVFSCNGKPMWTFDQLDSATGFLGIQAEGAAMEFRNLRVQELP